MEGGVVTSKILSSRDLEFMLFEWLDARSLTERPRFQGHSESTFRGVLGLSDELATEHFAGHNRLNDLSEPRVHEGRVIVNGEVGEALRRFAESGLIAATIDEANGGFQLPEVIHRACFMWFQAANIGTISYPRLTMANAHLLLTFGSDSVVERYVTPMLEGRYFGTMCLSEPGVGSSLGDLTTGAVRQDDGAYLVRGNKMWISGGEHDLSENIIHLVLARTGKAKQGTRGLSLFVVPKYLLDEDGAPGERNDVDLVGINHKMGYRGTVNTALTFGSGAHSPRSGVGAVGFIVGEEGQGLAQMFHMMNEARIAVGAGAAALGYTGYLHALDTHAIPCRVESSTTRTPQSLRSPSSNIPMCVGCCSRRSVMRRGRRHWCSTGPGCRMRCPRLPGVTRAARLAYEQAGLGPQDVDVAEVHDGAAPAELIVYEQLGFCGPGEGPGLLASGATSLGGRLPVNTGGGLLSRGHPIGATGCAQLVELIDQLRGRSAERQVPGARVALAENAGGYLDNDSRRSGSPSFPGDPSRRRSPQLGLQIIPPSMVRMLPLQ